MKHFLVGVAILAISVLIIFPLFTHLGTHLTSPDDGPLIAWLLHHTTEFFLGSAPLYDLPFFYPYKNTLAYSDPFLSTGFINVFFSLFTTNLIAQMNLHFILGTFVCFGAMYLLAYELVKNKMAAWLAGFVFVFSYLHFLFIVHLHTYLIAGLPLAVYFLISYLKTKNHWYVLLLDLCFLYQALNAPMTAYFLAAILATLLLEKKVREVVLKDRVLWAHAASTFLLCVAFYLPYFQVSSELHMTRSIRDAAHFSFSITRLWDWDVVVLGGLIAVLWVSPRKYSAYFFSIWNWVVVSLIGLSFMLGPVVKYLDHSVKIFGKALPLPYAVAYYLIPGMNAFRSVTRWGVLGAFGGALLVAYLYAQTKLPTVAKLTLAGILVISFFFYDRARIPLFQIAATPPPIYAVVKEQPDQVLAELPGYLWDMSPYSSSLDEEMLYQIEHGKQLYLGDSGLTPPQLEQELITIFNEFPSEKTITILKQHDIGLLIMHYGVFQQMYDDHAYFRGVASRDPAEIRAAFEARSDVTLLRCIGTDCLYRISL